MPILDRAFSLGLALFFILIAAAGIADAIVSGQVELVGGYLDWDAMVVRRTPAPNCPI